MLRVTYRSLAVHFTANFSCTDLQQKVVKARLLSLAPTQLLHGIVQYCLRPFVIFLEALCRFLSRSSARENEDPYLHVDVKSTPL